MTNIQNIQNYISTPTVTGYGLIKVLNNVLADLDETIKPLPTPMGYTYLKKGYVTGTKNVKSCTRDEAAAWIEKYLTKRFASQIVAEEVQVEEQYVGFENEA